MPLTNEQVLELKKQLAQQVQHLPEDQKVLAMKEIKTMSPEALETMLKQQQTQQSQTPQKAIFRAIVDGDIPSKKIDENQKAIATLDIKPISEGHTIIIPKMPIVDAKKLPAHVFSLAKRIAKKLSTKLKAKGTEIQTEFKFGEIIVNVIPIYKEQLNINSPRQDAKESDLESLYKKLRKIKKTPIIKKKKQSTQVLKLRRRIP